MIKTCNKCFFTGHTDYFVSGKKYPGGVRPYCKVCAQKDQRIKSGLPPKEWEPKFIKKEAIKKQEYTKHKLNITEEGLMILIKNGFARNREEALKYIQ